MYSFTLIIPTHNRHQYLKRSIEYFKKLEADIIYCDSSELSYDGELNSNIIYFHLPRKRFPEKILFALDLIKTDYVALCADDDFIVIETLYLGVEFLENNTSFKTVLGEYIAFNQNFNSKYYRRYENIPLDLSFKPSTNAKLFFGNYFQILWAMYDKKVLTKAFQVINKAKFENDNFIELVIGAIACFEGGIKFLNQTWGVRELNIKDNWGKRHPTISNLENDKIKADYLIFEKLVDHLTFKGYSKIVIVNYLKFANYSNDDFLKRYIKKIVPKKILSRLKIFFLAGKSKKKNKVICIESIESHELSALTEIITKHGLN